MSNKKTLKNLIFYIGIPFIIILIIAAVWNSGPKDNHKYSDIVGYFRDEKVSSYSMNLGTGEMEIYLKDNNGVIRYTTPSVSLMYEDIKDYVAKYNQDNPENPMTYDLIKAADTSWIMDIMPTLILLVLMGLFWWFLMRKMSVGIGDGGKQMNFGKAKIKNMNDEKRKTTFDNVAGADEEKEELREIVEFLKDPKK